MKRRLDWEAFRDNGGGCLLIALLVLLCAFNIGRCVGL
jgi:hypothetical protein